MDFQKAVEELGQYRLVEVDRSGEIPLVYSDISHMTEIFSKTDLVDRPRLRVHLRMLLKGRSNEIDKLYTDLYSAVREKYKRKKKPHSFIPTLAMFLGALRCIGVDTMKLFYELKTIATGLSKKSDQMNAVFTIAFTVEVSGEGVQSFWDEAFALVGDDGSSQWKEADSKYQVYRGFSSLLDSGKTEEAISRAARLKPAKKGVTGVRMTVFRSICEKLLVRGEIARSRSIALEELGERVLQNMLVTAAIHLKNLKRFDQAFKLLAHVDEVRVRLNNQVILMKSVPDDTFSSKQMEEILSTFNEVYPKQRKGGHTSDPSKTDVYEEILLIRKIVVKIVAANMLDQVDEYAKMISNSVVRKEFLYRVANELSERNLFLPALAVSTKDSHVSTDIHAHAKNLFEAVCFDKKGSGSEE